MKNSKRNNQGFTLLEIIVVIIILGVLAGLALPRLFSNIEFSRSAEALNSISVVRQSIERCGLMRGSYATCNSFANLDAADPGGEAGTHFVYTIVGVTDNSNANGQVVSGNYTITATRNGLDNGDNLSTVSLAVDASATPGTITRTGSGAYASIQ